MLRRSLAYRVPIFVLLSVTACTRSPESRQSSPAGVQTASDSVSPSQLRLPAQERWLHLNELGVLGWHRQGWRGQGTKIAILDSGFRDYRQFLGKALPAQVQPRSFRKDHVLEARDSQHGILCGEVLHAIAPDAELLLANWEPDSPEAFLDAVRWARDAGARIISCSLNIPSWSDGEGGGDVHSRLQQLLGDGRSASDVLCFASAGNTAERHWCGAFAPNDRGWHRWQDEATANRVMPWGRERVAVELYGPVHAGYELILYRQSTGDLVGKSLLQVDTTNTCGRAVIRFEPEAGATYEVAVRCADDRSTPNADTFHLVILGGSLQYTTRRGSIPFPGDGACVIAVGAVDDQKHRVVYSSCGHRSKLLKPDFVATVPFPSLCRERPFAGTSAAAPQAAGLAALLWSQHQDWTPNQIIQAMRDAALDLGPPGHDYDTGYGLIRLPR